MLKGYVKRGSNTLFGPYIEVYVEGLIRQFGWSGEYDKYRNRRDAGA